MGMPSIGVGSNPIQWESKLGFDFEYWRNSPEFRALSRDRDVNFNESWDTASEQEEMEILVIPANRVWNRKRTEKWN